MTTLLIEPAKALARTADSAYDAAASAGAAVQRCDVAVGVDAGAGADRSSTSAAEGVLEGFAALPLRERVALLKQAAAGVFDAVNAPVVDWGGDAELDVDPVTVDEELAVLHAQRCALVELTTSIVETARSLEASTRVLADQHARVVSRHDVLDLDQLERRLSSPRDGSCGRVRV